MSVDGSIHKRTLACRCSLYIVFGFTRSCETKNDVQKEGEYRYEQAGGLSV